MVAFSRLVPAQRKSQPIVNSVALEDLSLESQHPLNFFLCWFHVVFCLELLTLPFALEVRHIFHPAAMSQAGTDCRNPRAAARCRAPASRLGSHGSPSPGSSQLSITLGQVMVDQASLPTLWTRTQLIAPASLRERHSPCVPTTLAMRTPTVPLSICSCVLFSSRSFPVPGTNAAWHKRDDFILHGKRWPDTHSIWPDSRKTCPSCSPES